MTIDEIKELIHVVNETGIAELVVQRGEHSVKIVRALVPAQERVVPVSAVVPVSMPAAATVALPAASTATFPGPSMPAQETAASPAISPTPQASSLSEADSDLIVKSPIVGTYYDAPSPDAPKFVKVGDRVEAKQVLCIIESMKLMNEIEAETAGTVVAKYIENGRPVEYGESLFSIRPLRS
jgi:acetyl-CoA carboxylase biotin carboxyl carrier protein